MNPQSLAGVSALCFAASHITAKRAVHAVAPLTGIVISLAASALVTASFGVFDWPARLDTFPILTFVGAGVIGQSVGRVAMFAGVDRLGVSGSAPITASIYPVFAVLGAILFLGEPADPQRLAGLGAIVVGVWLIARGRPGKAERVRERSGWLSSGVAFALLAGLAFGTADLLRKRGVDLLPHASFGAMVAASAAFVGWVPVLSVPSVREELNVGRRKLPWFVISGALGSLALLIQLHALDGGDIGLVTPIVATNPLAVFILSAIFLRDLERVTPTVILGGILTTCGTLVVVT